MVLYIKTHDQLLPTKIFTISKDMLGIDSINKKDRKENDITIWLPEIHLTQLKSFIINSFK